MTTDRRLKRLYPALDAKQRVILLLEDRKAGRPPDARLGATMPEAQRPELNRLIRHLSVANVELGALILALSEASHEQAWRLRWFEAYAGWAGDLAIVREYLAITDVPAVLREKMADLVAEGCRLRPPLDLDAEIDGEGLASFAPRFFKGLRDSLLAIAGQAYATEQIIKEFSGDLGADILRPEARELLSETLDRAFRLLDELQAWVGEIDVASEVDVDLYLADARLVVESARRRR